jgi:hypothetical protein
MAEKTRYRDPRTRWLYPMSTLNSWTARPFAAAFAALRLTPNMVSFLSLATSLAGCALWAYPSARNLLLGALLVHLGLVFDHADGQVARRRKMGSTWGMYLDMLIDRIVEVAVVLGLLAASLAGPARLAGLPAPWQPLGTTGVALLAAGTMGAMQVWRFLNAYNDVLYLRSHLRETKRLPVPGQGAAQPKRPLVPIVLNRDLALLVAVVGAALGQPQATLGLLLLMHLQACAEKVVVFRLRHKAPEGAAAMVLGDEYH